MSRRRYLSKKSLSEALALFLDRVPDFSRPAERVRAEDALGRITAEPVLAALSAPHYHGAAMDGIAVRAGDTFGASEATPITLSPIAPGAAPSTRGFTEVDTGAPLPPGADAVIMIEKVFPADAGRVAIREAAAPWQHVRLMGEDIVASEPLLPRGHRIRPYDIGALLGSGHTHVLVRPRPRVAILPTGDELVEPGGTPDPGQIIEFNSRVVAAFVSEWGGEAIRQPAASDDPDRLAAALSEAARSADIVAVIAGSSAGERDRTVGTVERLGTVLVHGVDIMPGKPAILGLIDDRPVVGVPGYPVSAAIVCQQFLAPLMARYLGTPPAIPSRVRAIVPRKVPSRLGLEEFVRVSVGRVGDRFVASPLGRGAGAISTLVRADAYLRIPALVEGLNAGEEVDVELLRPVEEVEQTVLFTGSHDLSIGLLEDALRRRHPGRRISAVNVGSLGGLLALRRGEAHIAGVHLLDPATGAYNLPDVKRHLARVPVLVVSLLVRAQGLIVARGNPKGIQTVADLTRPEVTFVNRQPGAGTRVLLDDVLHRHAITPAAIRGYEREEFTHMAVAASVSSGLADCGLGIHQAAAALDLDFVPVATEEYDLVLRRDFAESPAGRDLLEAASSSEFRTAVAGLAGYDASRSGTVRLAPPARRGRRTRRGGDRRRD